MGNFLYKIKHIPTGKFIRVKLTKEGINVWKEKDVISGAAGYGKVLHNNHTGWKTPPEPTNEDFAEIDCIIVKYKIDIHE